MPRPSAASTTGPASPLWLQLAPASFVLLWSTGYIGARLGLPDAEPFTFLLLRFAIAGAILLLVALAMQAPWPKSGHSALGSIFAGALIQGVYLGGIFWAISRGMPAGVAALIVALQPLLTAILARPLLGERIAPAHWLGLAVGLFGLFLVLWPKIAWTGAGITPATIGAAFLSVVGIVIGSISQKALTSDADLRTGTFLQYVGGALVVGIGALALEEFHIDWTPAFVFALGWLVVALSLGAISLYMLLIRHGVLARVATLFYLVPPVTALTAWAMFGETLSTVQLVGMGVTVGGVALAVRRKA